MQSNRLLIKESLNKALAKVKPDREGFEAFKTHLNLLLEQIDHKQSEEFNKNLISDFLKNTHYGASYFINVRESSDLVIHHGKDAKSAVAVLFEVKKPNNKTEMLKVEDINVKAFQQLVLYFLRERITGKNLEIKYLVATNIYEWFIFDAKIFEDLFAQNKALVKQFTDFEAKKLSGDKTNFFYKDIAKPAIALEIDQIKFTYFDIRDYADKGLKPLVSGGGDHDRELVELYKIFSPQHLLKLDFANDSNSLNKPFYNELLHIIGLTEKKEGGKKIIDRKGEGDRLDGSLIENAISRLDSLDKISQLKKPEEFGVTDDDKLFNVALRLSINWINRILFLKLLEAQLVKYHQGDREFTFLNLAKVQNYDDLNSLFFDVLAREQSKRDGDVRAVFANVPYLNSSLFEPTETEQETVFISNLKDRNLAIFGATVLKDGNGNRRSGELNALAYLFEFLDAYDFSSDELADGQEDSEKLINAAVLGLIFEKINGYKDGSFYTPSFITMYMCRETIRRAIVQKFNEVKGWNCENIDQLDDKISDKKEANTIINSLKICDPAVGSGHFLVSALNEIIAIKSELRVLCDRAGKSLKDYRVEVLHDKLLVYDDEGKLFAYNPKNAEKQRVQEALFHEKQSIIEGCLFGVDINPNSVTICRLRLWIELLKNAYYRTPPSPPLQRGGTERDSLQKGGTEKKGTNLIPPLPKGGLGGVDLETLPNIDINIKIGNSLISRFGLDVDVKQVLQKQKFTIEQYRDAVQTYRSAESKAQKREMETLIAKIKAGFNSSLLAGDPKKVKLRLLEAELYGVENQMLLLEETKAEVKAREKRVNKLSNEIDKLSAEIADIGSGRLYENALEWRFEFPEVLNDQGDFVGFDIVIGNPPYDVMDSKEKSSELKQIFNNPIYEKAKGGKINLYRLFLAKSTDISKKGAILCQIFQNSFLADNTAKGVRKYFLESQKIIQIDSFPERDNVKKRVFESVKMSVCILFSENLKEFEYDFTLNIWSDKQRLEGKKTNFSNREVLSFDKDNFTILSIEQNEKLLLEKINRFSKLCEIGNCWTGEIDLTIQKPYLREPSEEFVKMIKGAAVQKWEIKEKMSQGVVQYLDSKNYLKENNGIKSRHHQLERIVMQGISGVDEKYRLKTAYLKSGVFCGNSVNYIILENNNIASKYVLSLMNSLLLNWYFKIFSTNSNVNGYEVNNLPIPHPSQKSQQSFTLLADKILHLRSEGKNTTTLEQQIDNLVYKLYQLTYEEVKIIDPEFALSEQEYMAIKIE